MNNPVRPPLQSEIPSNSGSPEGREYGRPGRIYTDGISGSIWRKTSAEDQNTGWILISGGSSSNPGISVPANFDAARALPITPTPVVAFVQGAVTLNDGGQGTFAWIANSEEPDDGFNTLVLTANGANPGRLLRLQL